MSTQVQRERGDARRGRAGGGEAKRISILVVLISFMENVPLDRHAVLKMCADGAATQFEAKPQSSFSRNRVLADPQQYKVVKRTSDCY